MAFAEVSHDILGQFEVIVGQSNIIVDAEERYAYSHDETEDHSFLPDVVLKPGSAEEISKIMKLCNRPWHCCYSTRRRHRSQRRCIAAPKRCGHFNGAVQQGP